MKECGDNHQMVSKPFFFIMSLTQTWKKGFYNTILDVFVRSKLYMALNGQKSASTKNSLKWGLHREIYFNRSLNFKKIWMVLVRLPPKKPHRSPETHSHKGMELMKSFLNFQCLRNTSATYVTGNHWSAEFYTWLYCIWSCSGKKVTYYTKA